MTLNLRLMANCNPGCQHGRLQPRYRRQPKPFVAGGQPKPQRRRQPNPCPHGRCNPGAGSYRNPSAHGARNPGPHDRCNSGAGGNRSPVAYGSRNSGAHGDTHPCPYSNPPIATESPAPRPLESAPTATRCAAEPDNLPTEETFDSGYAHVAGDESVYAAPPPVPLKCWVYWRGIPSFMWPGGYRPLDEWPLPFQTRWRAKPEGLPLGRMPLFGKVGPDRHGGRRSVRPARHVRGIWRRSASNRFIYPFRLPER